MRLGIGETIGQHSLILPFSELCVSNTDYKDSLRYSIKLIEANFVIGLKQILTFMSIHSF